MNAKMLLLMLLGVGVLVGATALLKSGQAESADKQGELLLSRLNKQVNEVRKLTLTLGEEDVTFERQSDGRWTLPARSQYPADRKKLDQLVLALAQAKKLAAKTQKPERYGSLGLDPNAEARPQGERPTRVEVFDEDGQSLAAVWIGNRRSGTTQESYFVRTEGDPTCWLVSGNLRIDPKRVAWMDATLTDVSSQKMASVRLVHPDGEEVLLGKEPDATPGAALKILNLPEGQEPQSEFVTSRFAAALQGLRMDDVLPAEEVPMPAEELVTAEFWDEDGLHITVQTLEQDDKIYARLSADYDATGGPKPYAGPTVESELPNVLDPSSADATSPGAEPEGRSADEVQAQADALNAKTKGWVYVLPTWKGSALRGRMDELLKKPAEADPLDAGGLPDGAGPMLIQPEDVQPLPEGDAPPAAGEPDPPGKDPAAQPTAPIEELSQAPPTGAGASPEKQESKPVFEIDPDAVKDSPTDKPKEPQKKTGDGNGSV